MFLRGATKRVLKRLSGVHILRSLPRGVDLFHDVAKAYPAYRFETILDVGANVGQSAREFLKACPRAQIWCLEPFPAAYAELERAMAGEPRTRCRPVALGCYEGRAVAAEEARSDLVRLERAPENGTDGMAVTTLDRFCEAEGIAQVGLLKIDTEGWDLEVLKGGVQMLKEHRADWIQVEAGMNPDNATHARMEDLKAYLEAFGYRLFGLYEQIHEWPTEQPHLRRANLVFLSPRFFDDSRSPS